MNVRWTLGIDLGITSRHSAVLFDRQVGKPVFKRFTFPHTAAGLKSLIDRIKECVADKGDGKIEAVIEPTGKVWIPVAGYLREHDIVTLMPSPTLAAAYRRKRQKRGKSNQIDADSLARLPQAEGDRLNPACLRSEKTGELDHWCKFHEKLSKRVASLKNKIRSEFQLVSPQMLKCIGDDVFTELGLAFMKSYANPEKLLARGQKRVFEILAKKTQKDAQELTEIVQNVFACARSAVELYRPISEGHGMSFAFEGIQLRVKLMLQELDLCKKQLKEIEERIATLHAQIDPDAVSRSLPGFGKHISAVVDSAVSDIQRFPRAECFAAYVRTVPRNNSTGQGAPKGEHERQPLRTDGNRYLQKQFYLAADVARRFDVESAQVYLKLKSKGLHHNQAVIAVARHLALKYHSLKRRQGQDPNIRYQFRDLEGRPITKKEAKEIVNRLYAEAEEKKEAPPNGSDTHTNVRQTVISQSENSPERLGDIITSLASSLGIPAETLTGHLAQLQPSGPQEDSKKVHKKNSKAT